MRVLFLGLLALMLAGCGGAGDNPAAAPTEAVRGREEQRTLLLNPGWNAVGFRCVELSSITPNPAVAGMTWWDGRAYQSAPATAAAVNRAGHWHGFWLFATETTALSYSGSGWERPERLGMRLEGGWNLISFASEAHDLRCHDGQGDVAADTVVLEMLQPAGTGAAVDLEHAQPGTPYWLYSSRATVLAYSPTPSASPSASPAAATPSPSPAALPEPSPTPPPVLGGGGGGSSQPRPGLQFTSLPPLATAGQDFSAEVWVYAGSQDPVTIELEDGPAGSVLTGAQPETMDPVTGMVRFSGLRLNRTGPVKLRATCGDHAITSTPLDVVPGPAAALAFLTGPTDSAAGATWAPVTVQVTDAEGNAVVPSSPVEVTLATSSLTLTGHVTTTNDDGLAVFEALSQTDPGPFTLTASAPGLAGAASAPFQITP